MFRRYRSRVSRANIDDARYRDLLVRRLSSRTHSIFSNNLSLYAGDAVVFQYADDTQVLVSGPVRDLWVLISRLEASLASLNDWFCANALKVNATKTQLIVFGSRQNLRKLPDFRVLFRDAVLQPCAQVGNLGVTFDSTLSWDAHVSELSRRCTGLLIGLSHARCTVSRMASLECS